MKYSYDRVVFFTIKKTFFAIPEVPQTLLSRT